MKEENKLENIDEALACLKEQGLFAQKIVINGARFEAEFNYVIQSLLNTFLPPNTVLFTHSSDPEKQQKFKTVVEEVSGMEIGVLRALDEGWRSIAPLFENEPHL